MSGDIVFVCTSDGCDEGPWEGSHDAMAHCAENRGHAYTGKPADELEAEVIPASTTEERDRRNLQHKGDPQGALSSADAGDS